MRTCLLRNPRSLRLSELLQRYTEGLLSTKLETMSQLWHTTMEPKPLQTGWSVLFSSKRRPRMSYYSLEMAWLPTWSRPHDWLDIRVSTENINLACRWINFRFWGIKWWDLNFLSIVQGIFRSATSFCSVQDIPPDGSIVFDFPKC